MTPKSGTLVIPIDFGMRWNRSGIEELAKVLESRLQQPVGVCFLDDPVETFSTQIRNFVSRGIRRIVVLPLGAGDVTLSPVVAQKLNDARQAVADVHFHAMDPLSWIEWASGLRQLALDSIVQHGRESSRAGVVVVARGGHNPLEDADLSRISYLIAREELVQNVTYAFLDGRRPALAHAINQLVQNGAEEVLVIPWLADDRTVVEIEQETALAGTSVGVAVSMLHPTLIHPLLLDLFVCKLQAGCLDNKLQRHLEFVAQFKDFDSASSFIQESNAELTPEDASQLAELDRKLNALLPPEYQGQYDSVQPTSMGTAGLKYDCEGQIAWDEIWTSFCDLALAGGPPHRGTLLEAVTSAEVLAEPEQYRAVVKEIERGIRMVTGLPLITSRSPGWVGVICESEEMAVWLMRAIIVENVMVRREGDILYLPAGPKFTVKREIKNVITAIAKTVHYWKAHLFANRQSREGN